MLDVYSEEIDLLERLGIRERPNVAKIHVDDMNESEKKEYDDEIQ